jgi:hypothetical protein
MPQVFQNVGHLPARKLYWLVKLNRGGSDWRPQKIKSKELVGENVIPIGAEWPQGSKRLPDPQNWNVPHQDETGLCLYVWGRVTYKDGFRWRKRKTDFCHCYPWQMRTELSDGGVKVGTRNTPAITTTAIAQLKFRRLPQPRRRPGLSRNKPRALLSATTAGQALTYVY